MEVVVEDVRGASGAGPNDNWEAWLNFTDEEFEYHHEDRLQFYRTFRTREDAEDFAIEFMKRNTTV